MHGRPSGPQHRILGRYDYPTNFRLFEVASLACFAVFFVVFGQRILSELGERFAIAAIGGVVLVGVLAFLAADFLSGLVHFLCDNLGTPDTPVLGQKFIKAFREHHDDPAGMTEGDFIEVNADNFFVCLPVLIPCVAWLDVHHHLYLAAFLALLMVFVTITNEVHKWAHMVEIPAFVRGLQRTPFFLAPAKHHVHHTAPYDSYYCITSGVLNPALARTHFWQGLLRLCRHSS
jgi:TMEM189-like protein